MAAFCHLLKFSLWLHMVSFLPYMFYRSLKVKCVYYYYWNTVMCVCVCIHIHIFTCLTILFGSIYPYLLFPVFHFLKVLLKCS